MSKRIRTEIPEVLAEIWADLDQDLKDGFRVGELDNADVLVEHKLRSRV